MSSESRLTTGELAYLSETSRNSLVKAAEIKKESAGKPWFSKDLVDHILPLAAGAGVTGYESYSDPTHPWMALGKGVGTASLVSPGGWRNVKQQADQSPDKWNAWIAGGAKALVRKGSPLLAAGAIQAAPGMLDDVRDTVHDFRNTVGNTDKLTGALAAQSTPMAKGIVSSMNGMQDTLETIKYTTANLANAGKATGPAISDAAKSIGGAADAIKTVPDAVSSGVNKAVIGGLAGGGGLLLLHHLLKQREEKKRQQQAPVLQ